MFRIESMRTAGSEWRKSAPDSRRQNQVAVRNEIRASSLTRDIPLVEPRGVRRVVESPIDIAQSEDKNLLKMAAVYDAMPPENAAKIMQQLADTGKMETAVKLLSQMKETKAAKVLAEMSDPALAAQMTEKVRGVKRASTPLLPTPPG